MSFRHLGMDYPYDIKQNNKNNCVNDDIQCGSSFIMYCLTYPIQLATRRISEFDLAGRRTNIRLILFSGPQFHCFLLCLFDYYTKFLFHGLNAFTLNIFEVIFVVLSSIVVINCLNVWVLIFFVQIFLLVFVLYGFGVFWLASQFVCLSVCLFWGVRFRGY